ncbi:adenosylcobinamide-phosphate synthase CbiB [Eubacterium sp.]|uniref:adenosylcobinamide-phosphate synthase CbiB n=1 Tax=Eubacterium sp. TaxID=142586 RepID=UPI0026DFD4DD|nr:adenosylcobinamide-phosphate synthase CbiB [Eubacterium sp.]MDO5432284.1 adenosylcobinamide-phosphate synthase CbiB [Eubacterium sp.]
MLLGMSAGIWFCLIVGAVVLDRLIGDPAWIPHPIVYIGKLVGFLTKKLNKGKARKFKGLILWVLTIVITGAVILAVQYIAYRLNIVLFYVVNLYLLSTTIAAKCLQEEVMKVYDALRDKDIPKARTMVGYLVGRDTQELQEGGIVRATVETTAENTIDGVLAPIFYMIIGVVLWVFVPFINPLLLAMLYKAVNTMDSMVGYVQEPYKDFGYFPAKIDDIANFVIARIGSWFMLIGGLFLGYRVGEGQRIYARDRKNHKSPNSGHPESVVAGLLGVQLGGTNLYFGQTLEKPTIGDAGRILAYEDIKDTISIMFSSEVVMMVLTSLIFFGIYIVS